jgi:molybdopterin/thiamine biosynthesis adenylyltransferase
MKNTAETFYSQFIQSNEGLIPKELQQAIRETPIALLGAGIGSMIGMQLAQSGCENISAITDPDKPETSNLNRQWFIGEDVRRCITKPAALANHMKEINPYIGTKIYEEGTTPKNAKEIVTQAEIIIDAMDPFDALEPAILINQLARTQNKSVIFPLELAFTAGVYIFDDSTLSLEQFYGLADYHAGRPNEDQKNLIATTLLREADEIGRNIAYRFMTGELTRYPQSPLTTAAASTLTVLITQKLIADKHGIDFLPQFNPVKAPAMNKYNLLNISG